MGEENRTDVWLRIEVTRGVPELDNTKAMKQDEHGNFVYIPDEKGWQVLHPDDVPAWLQGNEVVRDLAQGQRVCKNPHESIGRWYKATVCYPNEARH